MDLFFVPGHLSCTLAPEQQACERMKKWKQQNKNDRKASQTNKTKKKIGSWTISLCHISIESAMIFLWFTFSVFKNGFGNNHIQWSCIETKCEFVQIHYYYAIHFVAHLAFWHLFFGHRFKTTTKIENNRVHKRTFLSIVFFYSYGWFFVHFYFCYVGYDENHSVLFYYFDVFGLCLLLRLRWFLPRILVTSFHQPKIIIQFRAVHSRGLLDNRSFMSRGIEWDIEMLAVKRNNFESKQYRYACSLLQQLNTYAIFECFFFLSLCFFVVFFFFQFSWDTSVVYFFLATIHRTVCMHLCVACIRCER